MKLPKPVPVREIAEKIGAEIIGNPERLVWGLSEIHKVQTGDMTFVDKEKYYDASLNSAATFVIMNCRKPCPEGKTLLICNEPFHAYNQLVAEHRPFIPLTTTVAETAVIHPTAVLEPHVVVGHNVRIGAHTVIQANTSIVGNTIIGENVKIHPNTVIGSDAFYYKRYDTHHEKWNSGGRVIIGDNVEIGACCTINIGVSSDTVVGAGTKLDSQVHIGHDATIGKDCLFAAQVGIGGMAVIEDGVCLYGQVGVAQNVVIGAHAVVLAQSGVSKSLEGGKTYFGSPAQEVRETYKQLALLRQLPELMQSLKALEQRQSEAGKNNERQP